jgi:alkylation response protein AidB-like acyl-CoA dehydrogenase
MNGEKEFNEVFLTEARVPHADVVGAVNGGWTLAKETFALARAFNSRIDTRTLSGVKAGCIDRPAIDFLPKSTPSRPAPPKGSRLIPLASEWHRNKDLVFRQELAQLYIMNQIRRFNALRLKAGGVARPQIASGQKIIELDIAQFAGDLGCRLLGPAAMLAGDDAPAAGVVEHMLLTSPMIGIAGGTNNIVRNVLAERVLGLPRERDESIDMPFKDIPKS